MNPFDAASPFDARYYFADRAFFEKLNPYVSENAQVRYLARVEAALAETLADFKVCPRKAAAHDGPRARSHAADGPRARAARGADDVRLRGRSLCSTDRPAHREHCDDCTRPAPQIRRRRRCLPRIVAAE